MQYSGGQIDVFMFRGKRSSAALIRYCHRGLEPGMMIYVAIGYKTRITLILVDGNLEAERCISDILHSVVVLCVRACQTPYSIKITQHHILNVVLWPSFIYRVFDCWPGLHVLQICHLLKTNSHELLRDWTATLHQLIWLIMCGISLKKNGLSFHFRHPNPFRLHAEEGKGHISGQKERGLFILIWQPCELPNSLKI